MTWAIRRRNGGIDGNEELLDSTVPDGEWVEVVEPRGYIVTERPHPNADLALAAARRAVIVTRVAFVLALLAFACSVYNTVA